MKFSFLNCTSLKFLEIITIIKNYTIILADAYIKNPNAIFLAGGMPNAELFPFKEISITYSDGTQKTLNNKDLSSVLQYGPSQGYI